MGGCSSGISPVSPPGCCQTDPLGRAGDAASTRRARPVGQCRAGVSHSPMWWPCCCDPHHEMRWQSLVREAGPGGSPPCLLLLPCSRILPVSPGVLHCLVQYRFFPCLLSPQAAAPAGARRGGSVPSSPTPGGLSLTLRLEREL